MKRLKFPVVLFAAFIFLSCNSNPTVPGDPVQQFSRFPLTTGSTWNYDREFFFTNPRPENIGFLDTSRTTGKSTITGDTVINGMTVKVMRSDYNMYDTTFTGFTYFLDTDAALLRIAYIPSASVPFGPDSYNENEKQKYYYKKNGKVYSSIYEIISSIENDMIPDNSGDLIIENPPAVLFKYPVIINQQWLYKNVENYFIIYRKYIGFENIFTPGLVSNCIKVQRIIEGFGDNDYFYDYYSERGPVKRDNLFKDIIVTNEFGQEIGLIDAKEIHILTGY